MKIRDDLNLKNTLYILYKIYMEGVSKNKSPDLLIAELLHFMSNYVPFHEEYFIISVDEEEDECAICKDEEGMDVYYKLSCNHKFHSCCIKNWAYASGKANAVYEIEEDGDIMMNERKRSKEEVMISCPLCRRETVVHLGHFPE